MTEKTPTCRSTPPFLRFALGILLIMVFSLAAFYLIMRPALSDLRLMALFLTVTAIISTVISFIAYRLGWMYRSPTIRWTMLGGYVLASLLTFINVWMTARLMFASQHDLLLATVLLLFAGAIAIALGFFLTAALTDRIQQVDYAAKSIAAGNLETRVPVEGNDEISDLARSFNLMAEQLQAAERKKQEIETLRRDLIAWVSHDLQTPLTSIRAVLEALADNMVEDPQTVHRYLRTAQKDVAALSLLIDDLFELAQLDAGGLTLERANASISDLVSDTIESFSELAFRKGVTLSGDVEQSVDPVWMDTQRIGRVLNNLISNALRYTPAGGTVNVQVTRGEMGVVVGICDTGEGIKEEDLPYIFERFYRGEKSRNRATGGAGLGLAISRGIVEAHGGRITVRNNPNGGTCFTFNIP